MGKKFPRRPLRQPFEDAEIEKMPGQGGPPAAIENAQVHSACCELNLLLMPAMLSTVSQVDVLDYTVFVGRGLLPSVAERVHQLLHASQYSRACTSSLYR